MSGNRSANCCCPARLLSPKVRHRPSIVSLVNEAQMIRTLRKVIIAFCIASPAVLLGQHGAGGSARPALTPAKEAGQFDFLIGQWELVVTPKVNSLAAKIHGSPKFLGTWKAWRAVDGFGVEDELRIMDRSGNPSSLSQALRVYSANERKWIITGIDAYRG